MATYLPDRDPEDNEGIVTVRTLIDNRTRPVRVALGADDSTIASQANDMKRRVIVAGQLHRSPRLTLRMSNITMFAFEQSGDLQPIPPESRPVDRELNPAFAHN